MNEPVVRHLRVFEPQALQVGKALTPTNLPGCDGNRIFEYCVALRDCCPIHIDRLDPRDNTTPALPDRFNETNGLEYFIGVQAVVGHSFDANCQQVDTPNQALDHFWGWHTSPARLGPSLSGRVIMEGLDWLYAGWPPIQPICGADLNQAFELLTGIPDARSSFVRGDGNSDTRIDLSDAISVLRFLFLGGRPPLCLDAADAEDNGFLNISDAVVVLSWLFLGRPPPTAPSPSVATYPTVDCGRDPTMDALGCDVPSMTCSPP